MQAIIRYILYESTITREVIYALSTQILIFYIADHMMVRKRPLAPVFICFVLKVLMFFPTELYFLSHPELNAATNTGMILYSFWRDILTTGLFLWTYGGNSGKEGLSIMICETGIVVMTMPIMVILNYVEGRESLTEFAVPLKWMDLLIPVLFWGVWRIIRRPIIGLTEKYRRWRPRYSFAMWGIFFIYWLTSCLTSTAGELGAAKGETGLVRTHQAWGIAGMMLLMAWLLYQQRQEAMRHEYLTKQSAFAQAYHQIFERNRTIAAGMQEQIGMQMDALSLQQSDTDTAGTEQIRSYLEQLRGEVGKLQTGGTYCGNYLVDAVLCLQQQIIEEQGLSTQFQCVNVPVRMSNEAILPQILELVCEEWLEQKKNGSRGSDAERHSDSNGEDTCRIRITGARGQIIVASNIYRRWKNSRRKILKDLLAEAGGVYQAGKEKDRKQQDSRECIIMLPAGGEASEDRTL